jgi:hypothetical protein
MTQALYAHMNNKTIKIFLKDRGFPYLLKILIPMAPMGQASAYCNCGL